MGGLDSSRDGSQSATAANTDDTAHSAASTGPVKRPLNSFMLYRRDNLKQVRQHAPSSRVSEIIGQKWREETIEVKRKYIQLAIEERTRHAQQFPDFKYRPNKRPRPKTSLQPSDQQRPAAATPRKQRRQNRPSPATKDTPHPSTSSALSESQPLWLSGSSHESPEFWTAQLRKLQSRFDLPEAQPAHTPHWDDAHNSHHDPDRSIEDEFADLFDFSDDFFTTDISRSNPTPADVGCSEQDPFDLILQSFNPATHTYPNLQTDLQTNLQSHLHGGRHTPDTSDSFDPTPWSEPALSSYTPPSSLPSASLCTTPLSSESGLFQRRRSRLLSSSHQQLPQQQLFSSGPSFHPRHPLPVQYNDAGPSYAPYRIPPSLSVVPPSDMYPQDQAYHPHHYLPQTGHGNHLQQPYYQNSIPAPSNQHLGPPFQYQYPPYPPADCDDLSWMQYSL